MKKILTCIFLLFCLLCLTSCSVKNENSFDCSLYYSYIYYNKLENNALIELEYLYDENICIPVSLKFETKFYNNVKTFMSKPKSKILFNNLNVNIYCDEILVDTKKYTNLSDEQINVSIESDFWNSYRTTIISYNSPIDYSFKTGKYRIEFNLEIMDGDELLKFNKVLFFEIVESKK